MSVRLSAHALLLLAAALVPLSAQAHSQVRDAGACVSVNVGNPNWNNANRAETNNNQVATSTIGDNQTTDALVCDDYGFTIPAAATIFGIIVRVERRTNDVTAISPTRDASMRILKGGVAEPAERATVTDYTLADVVEDHGSAIDLWGTTWTPAEINNANFGARFQAQKAGAVGGNVTVSVDHVQIEVFYNQPPPQVTLTAPADGATVTTSTPTFTWNAAADADGDTVTYDIQADESGCTFPSPEIDQTGLTATSLIPTPLFAGTYCWRVRAVDEHGIAGAWSTTRNVTIDPPATLSQTASPGNCVSVNVGNPNWNNPDRAETNNASYATSTLGDNTASDQLVCTQYGFTVPTGAVILGIVISVERRTNDVTAIAPTRDFSMRVLKAGVAVGADRATTTDYTLADVVEDHGSAVDLWGTSWTPAEINNANFGARFQAQKAGTLGGNVQVSVDHVAITVHFTNPAASPNAFNGFETSTGAGAITGAVQTRVAGSPFSLDVVAILSGAQHGTFAAPVLVDLLGNNTLGVALDAQNCPTAFTVVQTVATNPTISGGRSSVNFAAVPNSWRDVRVRIRFPVSNPSPSVTSCSTDNFAIRPDFFTVAASDNDWQTVGTNRALANTGAVNGVVHKAGQNFTLTLAVSPGTVTNYNTDPTVSALTTTLPAGGANGTLSVGTFSTGSSTRTSNAATYSEAGAFDLTLADQSFAQVDAADGTPADCTAAGRYICQSPAPLAVGRFVPDHFAVVAGTAPQFRTFDVPDAACSGARSFTYVGQQFGYATSPTATVQARNAGGAVTSNYRGSLWKLTPTGVTQTFSHTGKTINTALGAPALSEIADSGTGTLGAAAGDKISFARTTAEAPFTANISLSWSVSDAAEIVDAVQGPFHGTIATTTALVYNGGGSGIAFDSGAAMRFGRLRLANAHGSQLTPLPVPMEAQYWASSALGFITNVADHCTAIANGNVAMAFTGNVSPAPTCKTALSGGGTLSSGRRTLMFSAPGNANDGAAMLTVNLDTASGTTCTTAGVNPVAATGAARSYLRGNWTGAPYTDDPTARATFGAFKGSGEVIFIRENF
jgi:MSHA biogenesis protein MshQ